MTAELAVRTVRVHQHSGLAGGEARRRAEVLLRAMVAPESDRSVLIVRRLVLADPGPAAARQQLAELRRHAARPAEGWVDASAEAVLFTDEVEVLVCLTTDLMRRQADRWYWRSRLQARGFAPTTSLAPIWLTEPRWLPPALAWIESRTPGLAQQAVASLSPAEATLVLAALLPSETRTAGAAGAPRWRSPGPDRVPATTATAGAGPERSPSASARTYARWRSRLPLPSVGLTPPGRALLAAALILAAEPGAPPGELAAWVAGVGASTPDSAVWARPAPRTEHPADRTSDAAPSGSLGSPTSRAEGDTGPDRTGLDHQADRGSTISLPGSDPAAPEPPAQPRRVAAVGTRDGGDSPVWSNHASALYLINLVLRTAPDDQQDWAAVLRLARRMLRGRPHARTRARDPLWPLLRTLGGQDHDHFRPLLRWWRDVDRFLSRAGIGGAAFQQPGRIHVSRTHLDVVFRLDQIDLDVRVSGLDQDPGWVPQLGRIIAFHFENRP